MDATDHAVHKVEGKFKTGYFVYFDQIIKSLKKYDLYENTIILVTTDNGGGPWYSNR